MIGETWTVAEVLDAQALDELEGAGQAKRLTARICAEIHNAIRVAGWSVYGKENSQPPPRMDEALFLPVRIRPDKDDGSLERQRADLAKKVDQAMLGLCGY